MQTRILIAEDFAPFRTVIAGILEQRAGFRVVGEAVDGLEAVAKAGELEPDIILLDIGLPSLRGLQAAKLIRDKSPNSRIVFVTQEFSAAVVRESFRTGGQGFVHKSSAYADLIPAIDTVLGYKHFVSSGLGLSVADTHPRHVAQFCSDDTAFLDCFSRFVATALKADHAAIIVATSPHRERLKEELHRDGFDIDGAIQQGTYVSLDVADLVPPTMGNDMPGIKGYPGGLRGLMESAAKATGSQHPRIAFGGEWAGCLYGEGKLDSALQIERNSNDMIKTHDVDVLCAYPSRMRHEDNYAFESICAEHSTVYLG